MEQCFFFTQTDIGPIDTLNKSPTLPGNVGDNKSIKGSDQNELEAQSVVSEDNLLRFRKVIRQDKF